MDKLFAEKYYGQRTSMGLIITEGVQPSEIGQGFLNTQEFILSNKPTLGRQ